MPDIAVSATTVPPQAYPGPSGTVVQSQRGRPTCAASTIQRIEVSATYLSTANNLCDAIEVATNIAPDILQAVEDTWPDGQVWGEVLGVFSDLPECEYNLATFRVRTDRGGEWDVCMYVCMYGETYTSVFVSDSFV